MKLTLKLCRPITSTLHEFQTFTFAGLTALAFLGLWGRKKRSNFGECRPLQKYLEGKYFSKIPGRFFEGSWGGRTLTFGQDDCMHCSSSL